MIKVEESGLSAFKQDVLTSIDSIMQESDCVTDIRLQALRVRHKLGHDALDVKGIAAGEDNVDVFSGRSLTYLFSKRFKIYACSNSNANASSLIGIRRSDALQSRADLVVSQVALRDCVPRLMPWENELGLARDRQFGTRNTARFKTINFGEESWHINHNTVANDWCDVVVQNARWNELQRILLGTDDHRVASVVSTLVTSDHRILSGKKVDDLCFAFIAPLGSDDDSD
jgi:hypothetical protein